MKRTIVVMMTTLWAMQCGWCEDVPAAVPSQPATAVAPLPGPESIVPAPGEDTDAQQEKSKRRKARETAAEEEQSAPAQSVIEPDHADKVLYTSGEKDRLLRDALEFYAIGDLSEAEETVNELLKIDASYQQAWDLKNKLTKISERIADAREAIAEEYHVAAEYYYKKENYLDASLWVKRSLAMRPTADKTIALQQRINDALQVVLGRINVVERRRLMRGVEYFLSEDFERSVIVFRDLQKSFPEVNELLSVAITHLADGRNVLRSTEYYDQAVDDLRRERFKKAQENLYLALEMNRNNLNARYMLEQVNLELGLPRATLYLGQ